MRADRARDYRGTQPLHPPLFQRRRARFDAVAIGICPRYAGQPDPYPRSAPSASGIRRMMAAASISRSPTSSAVHTRGGDTEGDGAGRLPCMRRAGRDASPRNWTLTGTPAPTVFCKSLISLVLNFYVVAVERRRFSSGCKSHPATAPAHTIKARGTTSPAGVWSSMRPRPRPSNRSSSGTWNSACKGQSRRLLGQPRAPSLAAG
jgi:hypothetical protein